MYTIASMGGRSFLEEQAYSDTEVLAQQGEARESVFGYLVDNFPELEAAELREIMADVERDVVAYMDRDDIGAGWEATS